MDDCGDAEIRVHDNMSPRGENLCNFDKNGLFSPFFQHQSLLD